MTIIRRDLDTRVERLERGLAELTNEAHAARANFLMAVNQMGKFKEVMDCHVHTMTDDGGAGTSRPQGEVINIIHELVQVLESEANTMRVDLNGMRDAMAGIDRRLVAQEEALRKLCLAIGQAVNTNRLYDQPTT